MPVTVPRLSRVDAEFSPLRGQRQCPGEGFVYPSSDFHSLEAAAGGPGRCRVKPSLKSHSALAEVRARGAVRHDLPTDRLRATDEMAVFGDHP